MQSFLRTALVALLLLVGLSASPGGGGGGDSGVWILPMALPVSSQSIEGQRARATIDLPTLSTGIMFRVASNMGAPTCLLVGDNNSQPLPTAVVGSYVTIPLYLLIHIRDNEGGASGVILDRTGLGYGVRTSRLGTTGLRFQFY